jgi:hypothetical protein
VPPYEHRNAQLSSSPSKSGAPGEILLTSNWRSPTSSSSRVREAPPRRLSPRPLRSLMPPRHSQAPLLTVRQRAPPRPPRAPALRHLCGPWRRGRRIPPLGGPAPHRYSLPLPPPMMNFLGLSGERAPTAHAAGTPCSLPPGVGSSSPSCARPAPAPVAVRRKRPLGIGAGGLDRAAFTVTLC